MEYTRKRGQVMTREEAIHELMNTHKYFYEDKRLDEAIDMAIEALSAEPIKVITDDTIEVRYTDFEDIKRIILTNGDIFCKMFYEDNTQEDDGNYDSLIPDEYKTEPSVSIQPKTIANNCDLISRADAIEALSRSSVYAWSTEQDLVAHSWALNIIKALPSADRPSGEWVQTEGDSRYMCSVCKVHQDYVPTCMGEPTIWDYCPSCGARMKGGAE